jgi:hypothetical protein
VVFTTWCADTLEVHSFGALASARGSNLLYKTRSTPSRLVRIRGARTAPSCPSFGLSQSTNFGLCYPSLFFSHPSHPGLNPAGSPAEVSFVYLC